MGKAYQDIHEEIIELSIAGNAKAQFELYSLYSKAMYNVCMRILNSRESAEDALQDAFCEIFDKLDTFRFESSFGAWAKRIVVNNCINKIKKRATKLIYTSDTYEGDAKDEEEEDKEEMNWKVEKIRKAIEMLPEGYRIIINLYLMEGYDHNEISEILGISKSTSKTQYMKAKNKVKTMIHEGQV